MARPAQLPLHVIAEAAEGDAVLRSGSFGGLELDLSRPRSANQNRGGL